MKTFKKSLLVAVFACALVLRPFNAFSQSLDDVKNFPVIDTKGLPTLNERASDTIDDVLTSSCAEDYAFTGDYQGYVNCVATKLGLGLLPPAGNL